MCLLIPHTLRTGVDTTASLLAATLWLLAQNPMWVYHCRQEVETVLAGRHPWQLTSSDVTKLHKVCYGALPCSACTLPRPQRADPKVP